MLRNYNMPLQRMGQQVDQSFVMGSTSRPTKHTSHAPEQPERHGVTLEQLAHELNSLLDGSIRCVGLARRILDQPHDGEAPSVEHALRKLNLAQETMRHMATVLNRVMRAQNDAVDLLSTTNTIAETVERIHQSLRPMAAQARVTISTNVNADAGAHPTGPLEPVLLNGLRNAIEACAMTNQVTRRVELSISVHNEGTLVIFITDNGPGLASEDTFGTTTKSGGHGIGLELSRDIVEALGGMLQVMNVPFGQGAVFRVHVPLAKLSAS